MRRNDESDDERDDRVRLDKWLWAARFYKTRALAAEAVEGGKVQLNGDRAKRAKAIQPGDEIRIRLGPYEHHIVVRGMAVRRGPATDAAALYEETAASREARERLALQLRNVAPIFQYEKGRPSKKERRDIDRLRRGE